MEVFLSLGEKGVMAVLKDLIVHGSSRFLNTSYFNQLNTDKIGAEEGIFNKIVATTGDIGSLTVDDLTAGKATVLSLLDVRGELHTNQWTNSNIATIDGSFYITPTIGVPSGTMTTTANSVVINGSNFPISSLYVNGVNSDNTATTVAWTSGSKVLVTGEILVNGVYMPLGTLIGTLSANATASQIKVGNITDNRYQSAESLAEIGTQSTALPCRNVKISLYQTSRSSTLYPLGIFMTALGENGKTFLDIYGGGYATSTATAGGFAKPVLRIGNLAGLPTVGGSTPTGYGIYTSNGYFSGVIVSTSGKIANFTINGSKLYSNNHSAYNTAATGIYIGDDYISFGSGGVTYFNSSGTGKVGPWTLTTTALYNTKTSYNNSNAGVYIGTDYIAGGAGEKWWLKSDGSAKIGAMTLTSAGVLTVPAANVSGELTAATISGSKITTGTIDASQVTVTNINADNINSGQLSSDYINTSSIIISDFTNDSGYYTSADVDERIEDQTYDLVTTVSDQGSAIASNSSRIDALEASNQTQDVTIESINASIVDLFERIDPYENSIIVTDTSVTVQSGDGSVRVEDDRVAFNGGGNTVAWTDTEALNSKKIVATELHMGSLEVNDDESVSYVGSIAIIARQNGRVSIKKVQ